MRKGLFAKYSGKIYRANIQKDSLIKLISEDANDEDLGFKMKIYPDYYKNKESLPKLYIKEVSKHKINELFEVETKVKYKGYIFNVSSEKGGNYYIGTTDAALAKALNFDRTDKYYYEKWVAEEDVEVFEEIKEIAL
ncbi:hypothetical protein [Neobacillus jeddahensis]|uniref:hypothetical protein n=1 Tax=Neobacillus jeddahensis TaxID=1461580 RepID=UPI000693939F|nr:hypothetical protein [Neobacillus jeddahensis]